MYIPSIISIYVSLTLTITLPNSTYLYIGVDNVISQEHNIDGKVLEVRRAVTRSKAPTPKYNSDGQPHSGGSRHGGGMGGGMGGGGRHGNMGGGYGGGGGQYGAPGCKIFVGGLLTHATKQDLNDCFSMHGIITDSVIMVDRATDKSRGFGFVTYKNPESATKCMEAENKVLDKWVDVKRAQGKEDYVGNQGGGGGNMGMGGYGGAMGMGGGAYGPGNQGMGGMGMAMGGGYGMMGQPMGQPMGGMGQHGYPNPMNMPPMQQPQGYGMGGNMSGMHGQEMYGMGGGGVPGQTAGYPGQTPNMGGVPGQTAGYPGQAVPGQTAGYPGQTPNMGGAPGQTAGYPGQTPNMGGRGQGGAVRPNNDGRGGGRGRGNRAYKPY